MIMFCSMKILFCLMILSICKAIETEYLDMTYELKENIPFYPGITPFKMTVLEKGLHKNGYWLQLEDINTCVHVGTHMDAPCHFAKDKWCLHEIPFERLIAPAIVVDITKKMNNGKVSNLMPEDLEKWESVHGKIPDGSVMILKTGWGKFWENIEKYINGTEEDNNVPGISREAAIWLVNNTKIYGVGVETLSLDEGKSYTFEAHVILQAANIYGIENLANVDKLPVKGAIIYAMPIKMSNASGGPARIFAKLPNEKLNGNISVH